MSVHVCPDCGGKYIKGSGAYLGQPCKCDLRTENATLQSELDRYKGMLTRAEMEARDYLETIQAQGYVHKPCSACSHMFIEEHLVDNTCGQCRADALQSRLNRALDALRPFERSWDSELPDESLLYVLNKQHDEETFYKIGLTLGHCRAARDVVKEAA